MLFERAPQLVEPRAGQARNRERARRPARELVRQVEQRALESGERDSRTGGTVSVGLVDREYVGELEYALLDALELVAGAGQHEHDKDVDHVGDGALTLADADGLDQ